MGSGKAAPGGTSGLHPFFVYAYIEVKMSLRLCACSSETSPLTGAVSTKNQLVLSNSNYICVVFFSDVNQRFGWSKVSSNTPLYYICEIPRTEVSRIIQQTRDFGKYKHLLYIYARKVFKNAPPSMTLISTSEY